MKSKDADYKHYDTLYHEHWDNKLSFVEIAKKYNIHPGTVQYWFRILKVPTRNRKQATKLAAQQHKREYKQNKATVNCAWCNKPIQIWPYRLNEASNFYCSKECKAKHWGACYIGENAHNWKGGQWTERVSKIQWGRFKKLRKITKKRDNYTCQLCGSKKKLIIHHIIPMKEREDLAFEINNLITLCSDCHNYKVNQHEDDFKEIFTDIVAKAVNSVNPLT